jgi:hypothetical protein
MEARMAWHSKLDVVDAYVAHRARALARSKTGGRLFRQAADRCSLDTPACTFDPACRIMRIPSEDRRIECSGSRGAGSSNQTNGEASAATLFRVVSVVSSF